MNIIDILEDRGMLETLSSSDLRTLTQDPSKPLKVYCGFDPSADSLHLGNMVPIMALAWFQRCGHQPFVLVGGATGMIGDPSGKSQERQLLDELTLEKNQKGIVSDLKKILCAKDVPNPAHFLNNYDWFKTFSFIDFLRDVGKYFRVGVMIAKESVKTRMQSEEGMSFTEFSYQTLQGYDFYHLFHNHGVTVEIGGSDQWGNITAGIDYVRKVTGQTVYGLTLPLLTKSDGTKFGKSEKGAVFLSQEKVSPYEFYQYLIRVADADVIKLLRLLTFIELSEINEIEKNMQESTYAPNTAQKILAEHITKLVHGIEGLKNAVSATEQFHPGKKATYNSESIQALLSELPHAECKKEDVDGKKAIDVIADCKFLPSKSEVRRLIQNRGLLINDVRIEQDDYVLSDKDFIDGTFVVFSFGKKNKAVIQLK